MTKLDRGAPGVQWSADTSPMTAPTAQATAVDSYPVACAACGGQLGVDGYCTTCGQKARSLREHYELTPQPWVAGVCDIGQTHARNEDALALQADATRAVIVVCDGVTTSEGSDVASMAAARSTCDHVWASDPKGLGTPSSRAAAMRSVLVKAVARANQTVIDHTDLASHNFAATTIAIAVVDSSAIFCATLGDSRVYWLPDFGQPEQATKDHSLAQSGMDSGTERAQAEASIFAHTITKWLGRDATDLMPNTAQIELTEPGWLIVCSDGLWNYVSEAARLATLVGELAGEPVTAHQLATRLVGWANDQGGHDNITVACARVGDHRPAQEARASTTSEAVDTTSASGPTPKHT
ncbi:MAG: serine/threonine-protein phosphatase [Propionibacteriaceae bacterium]|jgi:serine/threonine protein phosphatase PrpC|nr:serine/threonine-protein phosphatase [Propionibacteriaceae bacterium]